MNAPHQEDLPHEEEAPGSSLRTAILHHLVTTILIVATLSFAIWGYFNFRAGDFFYEPSEQDESRTMQRFLVASQLHRFEFAAQAYEAIHNAPPRSMDDLVAEGLILESDLTYPSPKIAYSMHIEDDHAVVTANAASNPSENKEPDASPEPGAPTPDGETKKTKTKKDKETK